MRHVLVLLAVIAVVTAGRYPEAMGCPLCEDFTRRTVFGTEDPRVVCTAMQTCDFILPRMVGVKRLPAQTPLEVCRGLGMCPPANEAYTHHVPSVAASPLNIRVTRGYGTKGYNTLRVSVVDNTTAAAARSEAFKSFFDYSAPFAYRWTNKHLFSTLVNITPGVDNTISIDNTTVTVRIPREDAPTRGVLMADPCFSSRWILCSYGDSLQIFGRMTSLLNSAFSHHGDLDFWMILGDMFYDRDGDLADQFYSALTPQVLSSVFATTAGNHDYWVYSSPWLATAEDQFGYGFLQYYAMDSYASLGAANGVFNLSVDPDKPSNGTDDRAYIPTEDNFFFVNKIGNVAFMGYSGAYPYATMEPYFQKGCAWIKSVNASAAFLIGHWNADGMGATLTGCDVDMTVPAVYAAIKTMPGCSDLGTKLKYVMGHTHCNQVVEAQTGFMVAGFGMEGCGNFGIPYVDTNDGRLEILYFPIADQSGTDNYEALMDCVSQVGLSKCKQHATVWFNDTLANL